MNWTWFHRLASPPHVYAFAQRWTRWFGGASALAMVIALYGGLLLAPPDYQQKDAFRMVYVPGCRS
jgi:heme exporter protein C